MKRMIISNYHLYDDPTLPEIPEFEDFKRIFKNERDFGKSYKKDLRLSKNWECDHYSPDFYELVEDGIEQCWYGSQELLDDQCFWYLARGNNGWYGLALFDKEYNSYNELGAGDSFESCLNRCKPQIEAWLKECAYTSYNGG